MATAIARLNAFRNNTLPAVERAQITGASDAYAALWQQYQSRGWRTTADGHYQIATEQSAAAAPASGKTFARDRRLFYRLVDRTTGFEFRGRLNTAGQFDSLILNSDTYYAIEYLDPVTGATARGVFKSAGAARVSEIPALPMTVPVGLTDTDGDGLPDVVESIPGTRPDLADSDGDGISDGQELRAGTDPIEGSPLTLGVSNEAGTAHSAVDVVVGDDLAVVRFASSHLSIYNVHDPLHPVLVSELTLGHLDLTALAVDGPRAVCTDQGLNLYLIALDAPDGARVTATTRLGENSPVALQGGLLFTATGGKLQVREGTTAEVISEVAAPGEAFTELEIHDQFLYGMQGRTLGIWEIRGRTLVARGNYTLPELSAPPYDRGFRPFAETGRVYLSAYQNFRTLDVSDPDAPKLIGAAAPPQPPIHSLAHNGAGLLVASAGSSAGPTANNLRVAVYDVSDPRNTTKFLAGWDTPGGAKGLTIHRGIALVADLSAGLASVNFRTPDRGTNAPIIAIHARVSTAPETQEMGGEFVVTADATDDVQVSHVEFYLDGVRQRIDGGHPFAATLRAPLATPGKTTFTVRAKATDTGGNVAWSAPLELKLGPDVTAPRLLGFTPAAGTIWLPGELSGVTATFDEAMQPGTLAAAFRIFAVGADRLEGTADDVPIPATLSYPTGADGAAKVTVLAPLPVGGYFAEVAATATDLANNPLAVASRWRFEVRDALTFHPAATGWQTNGNWAPARVPEIGDIVSVPAGVPGRIVASGGDLFADRLDLQSTLWLGDSEPANYFVRHALTVRTHAELGGYLGIFGQSGLVGPGTFHNAGTIEYAHSGAGSMVGATLINDGFVRVNKGPDGKLVLAESSRIVNSAAGRIELVGSSGLIHSLAVGYVLENAGSITKTGAGAAPLITGRFIHSGILDVQAGQLDLQLDDDSNLGGVFQVAGEAQLVVGDFVTSGRPIDFGPNSLFTGAGTVRFNTEPYVRGTVNLFGTLETTRNSRFIGPVRVAGRFNNLGGETTFAGRDAGFPGRVLTRGNSVFATANEVRVGELAVAVGGKVTANTPVLVQGALSVSNNAALAGTRRLVVAGPANFQGVIAGTQLSLELGGVTTFLPGATLNFGNARINAQTGGELRLDGLSALTASEFRVDGQALKTSGATLNLAAGLAGTGIVEIAGGRVDLAGAGTYQGQLRIGPGATLRLTGNNQVFDTNSSLICQSQLVSADQPGGQTGASNVIRGAFSAPSVLVGRRLLRFDGDYTLPQVIVTNAGEFGGSGTVIVQQLILGNSANFVGTGILRLPGTTLLTNRVALQETRTVENLGHLLVQESGRLTATDAPRFINRAGATLEFRNDLDFINLRTMPLINEGTLLKSAGNGQTILSGRISNSGTMEIRTGALLLDAGNPVNQSAGLLWLNGGALRGGANLSGGRFRGNTTGTDILAGLSIAGDSELEIAAPASEMARLATASLSQGPAGVTHLDIAGATTPGLDFDELVVSVGPSLRGRLNLRLRNGYLPPVGAKFAVLRWTGNRTGAFDTITGEGVPAGRKWKITYEATRALVELAAE